MSECHSCSKQYVLCAWMCFTYISPTLHCTNGCMHARSSLISSLPVGASHALFVRPQRARRWMKRRRCRPWCCHPSIITQAFSREKKNKQASKQAVAHIERTSARPMEDKKVDMQQCRSSKYKAVTLAFCRQYRREGLLSSALYLLSVYPSTLRSPFSSLSICCRLGRSSRKGKVKMKSYTHQFIHISGAASSFHAAHSTTLIDGLSFSPPLPLNGRSSRMPVAAMARVLKFRFWMYNAYIYSRPQEQAKPEQREIRA